MKLIFATHNPHKVREVKKIVPASIDIVSLEKMGFTEDIPEPHETLQGNALEKVRVIHRLFGLNCFAEDTGLEIDALNGEPGVYTARYAGEHCSASDNIKKVLRKMGDATNRSARFKTVVSLIWNDKEYLFEGVAEGTITNSPKGGSGFGYDPVFQPEGHGVTFAEMEDDTKNGISHRAKATNKLVAFLDENTRNLD